MSWLRQMYEDAMPRLVRTSTGQVRTVWVDVMAAAHVLTTVGTTGS